MRRSPEEAVWRRVRRIYDETRTCTDVSCIGGRYRIRACRHPQYWSPWAEWPAPSSVPRPPGNAPLPGTPPVSGIRRPCGAARPFAGRRRIAAGPGCPDEELRRTPVGPGRRRPGGSPCGRRPARAACPAVRSRPAGSGQSGAGQEAPRPLQAPLRPGHDSLRPAGAASALARAGRGDRGGDPAPGRRDRALPPGPPGARRAGVQHAQVPDHGRGCRTGHRAGVGAAGRPSDDGGGPPASPVPSRRAAAGRQRAPRRDEPGGSAPRAPRARRADRARASRFRPASCGAPRHRRSRPGPGLDRAPEQAALRPRLYRRDGPLAGYSAVRGVHLAGAPRTATAGPECGGPRRAGAGQAQARGAVGVRRGWKRRP